MAEKWRDGRGKRVEMQSLDFSNEETENKQNKIDWREIPGTKKRCRGQALPHRLPPIVVDSIELQTRRRRHHPLPHHPKRISPSEAAGSPSALRAPGSSQRFPRRPQCKCPSRWRPRTRSSRSRWPRPSKGSSPPPSHEERPAKRQTNEGEGRWGDEVRERGRAGRVGMNAA